jgi:outer membrane cobalamin receptor
MNETRFIETAGGTSQGRRIQTVDGSAWLQSGDMRAVWSSPAGLSLDGGVRIAHATSTDDTSATPWLLAAWRLNQSWSLRAGAASAAQVPAIEQVAGTFGDPDARAERARYMDVALEHRIRTNLRWHVAVYDRREQDMLRLEDSETRLVGPRLVFASSLVPSWRNALSGSARGIEVTVQRADAARFSGWLGYLYARTRYDDGMTGESFWGDFDQRHTVSAFGQFRWSPQTTVVAKMRFGSNFPIAGYFQQRPAGLFAGANRNTVRLPEYSRLDLRADHAFNYSRRRLTVFVEAINVLNHDNVAAANGVVGGTGRALEFTTAMFPLLPSAGLRIDF